MIANIDVASIKGATYEHQYNGWIHVFEHVARHGALAYLTHAPVSWLPLLWYLGGDFARIACTVDSSRDGLFAYLGIDGTRRAILSANARGQLRELVECSATVRPEIVDALYKSDAEWDCPHRRHKYKHDFVVTSSSSFQRPEVLQFLHYLRTVTPPGTRCVLVPCAADKPYPAPLHKAVADVLAPYRDDGWYIAIATGVFGIVPETAWPLMPNYDSGIPNRWRLMHATRTYFQRCEHTVVVSYCDFYDAALDEAMEPIPDTNFARVNLDYNGKDYLDLMDPSRLEKLRLVLEEARGW